MRTTSLLLAKRVVALANPTAVTIAALTIWIGGLFASRPVAWALLTVWLAGLCTWTWSVFTLSTIARSGRAPAAWKQLFFLMPPPLVLAAAVFGWPMNNSPGALVFFATLFVALTWTAQALENVAAAGATPTIGRVLTTVMLMYFFVPGAWLLRDKISVAATLSEGMG